MIVTDLNFWREGFPKDKKLVVTNGCFDIIHAGHIHYLNEAKSFGDYLMVGINSDSGVRALKGNGRPVNCQDYRKYVLDNVRCVDFVYMFDEVRCVNFLKMSRPDIYVKGGDYTLETLNKEELVSLTECGSVIEFVNFKFDISTTRILTSV